MPDENQNPESELAPVLARDGDVAVVHLPNRRFPGVCFQGDTLWGLAQSMRLAAGHPDAREREAELKVATDRVLEALALYVRTLRERGMGLPFGDLDGAKNPLGS